MNCETLLKDKNAAILELEIPNFPGSYIRVCGRCYTLRTDYPIRKVL